MKKFFLLLLAALIIDAAFAQNADHKWSIGVFYGKTEYNGDLGNEFLFKSKDPFYQMGAISIGRYLSPSFNLGLYSSNGEYGYNVPPRRFLGKKLDITPLLYYKLNNGYILKAGAKLEPYIAGGVGYSRVMGNSDLIRSGNDIIFPIGGGIKFNFTSWMALQYQLLYVFTNHDYHDRKTNDHNEQFAAHTLGFVFSFGKSKAKPAVVAAAVEEVVPVPAPAPAPAPKPEPAPAPMPEPPVKEGPKVQYNDTVVVHYAFDKYNIESADVPKLDKLAKEMMDNKDLKATITGYTDNIGPDRVNMPLSVKRAEAVKNYLVNKGVDASRITTEGKGATDFVAPNTTPQGRQQNRRAVTIVTN